MDARQSMIPKSGIRFSEKNMLKIKSQSGIAIREKSDPAPVATCSALCQTAPARVPAPSVCPAMTVLSVRHVTTYRYKRPVSFGQHRIMFRPRDSYDQKLIEADLVVTPQPRQIRWLHDPFGNCVAIAEFGEK